MGRSLFPSQSVSRFSRGFRHKIHRTHTHTLGRHRQTGISIPTFTQPIKHRISALIYATTKLGYKQQKTAVTLFGSSFPIDNHIGLFWMRFRHGLAALLCITTGTAAATTFAVQRLDSDLNKQVQPFQPRTIHYLQKLPLKTITSCWAWLGNRNLPTSLREPTYRCYCNVFQCNVEEASEPLSNYENLHQFFARSLKPGARVFQQHAILNAPSDGTIVNCGIVADDQIEQVSGTLETWDALCYPKDAFT